MSRNRWITTLHSPVRILLGLAAVSASGLNTAAEADSDGIIAVHTIQSGEDLSKLAVQYYGNADDWEAIFEAAPQLDSPMHPNVAAGAIERADIATSNVRSVGAHARLELHVMAADTEQGEAFIRRLDDALGAMAERGSLDEIRERHLRLFQH